ncbi:MAG: cache domain-containing protein [Bacteroidales bacterium]|nr:cache domain-containing protein [Bacteroidales bacterium]
MDGKSNHLKKRKKYRLSTRFLSFSLLITISIVIAFALFSIIKEYNLFKKNAVIQRENLRNDVDSLLKNEVDRVVDYIRFSNLFTEKKLRTELQNRGHQAWNIAHNIYLENQNSSTNKVKKAIKDALRSIRFFNDRGYFFITSMKGIEELYPVRPEFEGVNVLNLQDSKGNYIIQHEIELLKQQDEGFVIDYWYKPGGSSDSAYPKTSFVKRFTPFNWYIGCGEYLDNVENDLKQEVLATLKSSLFSTKNNLFIYDEKGLLLLDPKPNAEHLSENFQSIHLQKKHLFDKIQQQITKAETSFFDIELIEYDSLNDKSYKIHARKLSRWNWIVASYSDLSLIEEKIIDENQFLKEELKSRLIGLLFFVLIVVIAIFILTRELQKIIRNAFIDFSHQLAGMINAQQPIDPEKFQMENFSIMAEYANKLLKNQLAAKKALGISEAKFHNLYKNAPVMILAVDHEMNLKLCNQTCDDFFNIHSDKFIGLPLPLARIIKTEDFDKLTEGLKSCDNKFKEYELNIIDGKQYIQNWASFKSNDDMVFWVGYDLTDLKKMQIKLNERQAFLNILINSIPTPVFYKDNKGRYQGANDAFSKMIGKSSEEYIGKEVYEVAPKHLADEYLEMDLSLMRTGGSQIYENLVKHADNSEHYYIFYKTVYNDLSGKPGGIIGIMLDITDRKKVEEQLRELNATKDKFFSIIAHDLKNPFNSLLGLSELLNLSYEEMNKEQHKEIIENMHLSANTLYTLLENLLHWARSQSGAMEYKPENINLFDLTTTVLILSNKQAEEKQITILNKLTNPLNVYADPQMTSTVIRNLISNAIKFTPENGEITIAQKMFSPEFAEISITDTGVGIPEVVRTHLFDIGNKVSTKGTRKESGSGLGLILCKEFVEKNGGKINIESTVGKGSRFYFTIPIQKTDTVKN